MKHHQSNEHIQACKECIEACSKCEQACNLLIEMGADHPDFAYQCEQSVPVIQACLQACHDCLAEHKEHMTDCPDRDCKRACEFSLKSLHECIEHAEKLIKHTKPHDALCLTLCKELVHACTKCIEDCKKCLTKKELLEK